MVEYTNFTTFEIYNIHIAVFPHIAFQILCVIWSCECLFSCVTINTLDAEFKYRKENTTDLEQGHCSSREGWVTPKRKPLAQIRDVPPTSLLRSQAGTTNNFWHFGKNKNLTTNKMKKKIQPCAFQIPYYSNLLLLCASEFPLNISLWDIVSLWPYNLSSFDEFLDFKDNIHVQHFEMNSFSLCLWCWTIKTQVWSETARRINYIFLV